ncbi:50S ribosomal protein L23 [Patescibacteria group bacterium]|nr:50S ribosomal protein L23 [Patescibacteria group bacterium]MBU2579736.1 50S ribosomal protein L23 [Patescibacteria group bacterium]
MSSLNKIKKVVSAYRVIKEPHITEKASYLGEQNKYAFKIYPKANKSEVKKAVEALYGTKVEKVNIIHSAPKKRRVGRSEGWRGGLKKGFKKAIVTLKKGEKIEIVG